MIQLLDKPQQFTHAGFSWGEFKTLQRAFDEKPGIRVAYFKGEVEILTVSPEHAIIAENLGFLLETWMLDRGIDFVATGDMTVERERVVSAQGDKSYCFDSKQLVPDLSIEVVIKGEGTSKLKRYAELRVKEVWFWQEGEISIYRLQDNQYQEATVSQFAPGIDLFHLAQCAAVESRAKAVKQFRANSPNQE